MSTHCPDILKPLTQAEYDALPTPSREQIREALAKGYRERLEAAACMPGWTGDTGMRYR